MRFLPIVFVIIGVASSKLISEKKSLNDIFDLKIGEIATSVDRSVLGQFKTANHECMRKKLKLAVNGDKLVGQNIGAGAVVAAAGVCLDNPESMYNNKFDEDMKELPKFFNYNGTTVDCFKQRLFELQPSSNLLVGFDVQHMKSTADECQEVMNIERRMIESTKKDYAKMGIEQCMAMDVMEMKIFGLSMIVLVYSQPEMAAEIAEFKKKVFEMQMTRDKLVFKCIMEKVDEELKGN
jgi:hypothetical protein